MTVECAAVTQEYLTLITDKNTGYYLFEYSRPTLGMAVSHAYDNRAWGHVVGWDELDNRVHVLWVVYPDRDVVVEAMEREVWKSNWMAVESVLEDDLC